MNATNETNQPYKVVVGYDFSHESDVALKNAVESLAGHLPAELHAVFAVHEHAPDQGTALLRAQEQLAYILRNSIEAGEGSLSIFSHTRPETPAEAIIAVADDVQADIIYVGTHQRGLVSRMLHPSTSKRVTRHASCPVIVIKEAPYNAMSEGDVIEAPCPHCLETRHETQGGQWWCDTHSKPYHAPHRYSTSDKGVALTRSAGSMY